MPEVRHDAQTPVADRQAADPGEAPADRRTKRVAVGSGKGGTGKTTVSTSLALALRSNAKDHRVVFLDCDVEEPDSAIYLDPALTDTSSAGVMVPVVDQDACTRCGECSRRCVWNAIAVSDAAVMTFPELCHGCGSCIIGCPVAALHEELYRTGEVQTGRSGEIEFGLGRLSIGSPMPVPVIRALKSRMLSGPAPGPGIAILDSPPGTACPFVETIRDADLVILVTEPTPFGLHDLRLAVEVARDQMGLQTGIVMNRDGIGDTGVDDYCREEGLPILMRIPFDREIATVTLSGHCVYGSIEGLREPFDRLAQVVLERTGLSS